MVTDAELQECLKLVEKPSRGSPSYRANAYEVSESERLIRELRVAVKLLAQTVAELSPRLAKPRE